MPKFLASLLLFLVLNIGSSKGINFACCPPAQAPAPAPFVPNSPPTEAPRLAPTASFGPAPAPVPVPPLHPPLPPPSPHPRTLPPQKDVNAVNALFGLSWTPEAELITEYNPSDCFTYEFWPRILCNCNVGDNTCRVTSINLEGQDLRGQVPEQIGNLTSLISLDLSSNKLGGSIPESVAKLSQLSVLKLNKNNFQGPIPQFLAGMKSLQTLDLSDNSFTGSTPHELGYLTSLKYLYLGNNLLKGSIPLYLGNISSLRLLDLHDNDLSGQLPEELGNLGNLQYLDLSNNHLNGSLPSSFQKLRMLQNFNIRGNSFSGTMPEFISNWRNLGKLILSGNNFSGPPLPTAITTSNKLTYIFITDIPGGGTNFSIPEVNNCVCWETLILRNCSLTGPIPTFIWNLRTLTHLDLSFNNFFGGIPKDVNPRLLNLKSVFLGKNKLNGTLPGWLTNLAGSHVDVSENFFTHVTVPTANISSNLNLFACCNTSNKHLEWEENYFCDNDAITYDHLYINCGGNAVLINGSNYEADMQRGGASTFFLSDNKAWAYSSMGTFLDRNQNDYIVNEMSNITTADAPLYRDARVSPISLKYFGFCLKNGDYTLKLHFAEIGWVESEAASIKRRRVFDIDIQGGQHYLKDFNIEEEAKGVDKEKIKEFNISVYNRRLEVHLYWSGKGSTPARYQGPLISAISLSPVKEHKKLPPGTVGVIAGSASLLVGLTLVLLWKLGWLDTMASKDAGFRYFNQPGREGHDFQSIKSATNNFQYDCKVGEGVTDGGEGFTDGGGQDEPPSGNQSCQSRLKRIIQSVLKRIIRSAIKRSVKSQRRIQKIKNEGVYKVKLHDDTKLAVKRISVKSKRCVQKIKNEIRTIYDLKHHPNLVSLKGYCGTQNELLLIHEYMEKGSLEQVLFGSPKAKSNLNWLKRVQICRDVAKGLVFLHENESKQQIIHSNIKPTNILLDKDFIAKISDFGYAEFNAEENTPEIEKIKRTSAYMAPEYVQGILTPKADVYSFGILMLEIISGESISTHRRKDSVYILDRAYVYKRQGKLINLLDADLESDYTYNEALKILDLAMDCVSPSAELRPTMPEVAKVLEEVVEVVEVEESKRTMQNESPSNVSPVVKEVFSQATQSESTSQERAISPAVEAVSQATQSESTSQECAISPAVEAVSQATQSESTSSISEKFCDLFTCFAG